MPRSLVTKIDSKADRETPYRIGFTKLRLGGTTNHSILLEGAPIMEPYDIFVFYDYGTDLVYAKKSR